MESIEKPIIMLELNRWEYNYFCLNDQKKKKESNIVQLESRGCHSQNSPVSSSARVVDVLEEVSLNKRWCHLGRWHQEVLCSNCPSADVRRGKERSPVQKGTTDMRAGNEACFASCLNYARPLSSFTPCPPIPDFSPQQAHRLLLPCRAAIPSSPYWGLWPAHCSSAANPPTFSFCFFKHPVCPTWSHKMLLRYFGSWFAVLVSVLCWPFLSPHICSSATQLVCVLGHSSARESQ